MSASSSHSPLHKPEQDSAWVPPLDMALGLARQALAEQADANVYDKQAMITAAVQLEIRLRGLVAALDKGDKLAAQVAEHGPFPMPTGESVHADSKACGTCKSLVQDGKPVKHEQCAARAVLLLPPDQPMYENLVDLTDEQRKALPARFHTPVFDGLGKPNAWLCQVCWGDGWVSQWPCGPAQQKGAMVFVSEGTAEDIAAELVRLRAQAPRPRRFTPLEEAVRNIETAIAPLTGDQRAGADMVLAYLRTLTTPVPTVRVSPWDRAVAGLNALVDANIAFWIEPDGHISGPFGDEHIEWDHDTSRWRLVHDDEDDVHPRHPSPCRVPDSPNCTCPTPAARDLRPGAEAARRMIADRQTAEDPHDSPLHRTYETSHDLPEVGGYRSAPLPAAAALCATCGHNGAAHHHAGTACWADIPKRLGEAIRLCKCSAFVEVTR